MSHYNANCLESIRSIDNVRVVHASDNHIYLTLLNIHYSYIKVFYIRFSHSQIMVLCFLYKCTNALYGIFSYLLIWCSPIFVAICSGVWNDVIQVFLLPHIMYMQFYICVYEMHIPLPHIVLHWRIWNAYSKSIVLKKHFLSKISVVEVISEAWKWDVTRLDLKGVCHISLYQVSLSY